MKKIFIFLALIIFSSQGFCQNEKIRPGSPPPIVTEDKNYATKTVTGLGTATSIVIVSFGNGTDCKGKGLCEINGEGRNLKGKEGLEWIKGANVEGQNNAIGLLSVVDGRPQIEVVKISDETYKEQFGTKKMKPRIGCILRPELAKKIGLQDTYNIDNIEVVNVTPNDPVYQSRVKCCELEIKIIIKF